MRMGVGKAKNVLSTCESRPFEWRKPRRVLLAEKHARKEPPCDRAQKLCFMRHTSMLAMPSEMPSLLATGRVSTLPSTMLTASLSFLLTLLVAIHAAHTSPSQHPDHLQSSRHFRHPSATSCCHTRPSGVNLLEPLPPSKNLMMHL